MNDVNSISIYDETNVIIKCPFISNNFEEIILAIYGTPRISLDNSCIFDQVEIYGSPTFNLCDNSIFYANNLYLYNQTYQFPFNFNHIYFTKNITNKTILYKNNNNKKQTSLYCSYYEFKIDLYDDVAKIKCGEYQTEEIISYDMFKKYNYRVVNGSVLFINQCTSNETTSENVKIAFTSLLFYGRKEVTFSNFSDLDTISFYTDNDEHETWIEFEHLGLGCLWRKKSYSTNIFDDYLNRGWKKVCKNDYPYLYCCDSDLGPKDIIIISKAGSFAIIIIIILVLIALLISLCSIAYCRYSNWRRVFN